MNSSTNYSDLWTLALESDHDAYALLHKSLYPGLYNYIFQMMKDEELVNDLLQELFVKLWQKRNQIGVIKNVKAYFFTASRSMAINHFRNIKSKTIRLEMMDMPEIDFSAEDIMITEEGNTELKIVITQALNKLPARQREIIYLKYYEEMEYQKIAEVTGIQYQSVINHVFRALQTLRTAFKSTNIKNVYFF